MGLKAVPTTKISQSTTELLGYTEHKLVETNGKNIKESMSEEWVAICLQKTEETQLPEHRSQQQN